MKRETFKDIEIQGRKFRVLKFDPWTGSWLAFSLMTNLLPFGIERMAGVSGLPGRPMMNKESFLAFELDCLKFVQEFITINGVFANDPIPIVMESGSFVSEMDTVLLVTLVGHALAFNVQSFFDQMDGIISLLPPALQEKIQGLNLSGSESSGKTFA